jgi:hypothetical protein
LRNSLKLVVCLISASAATAPEKNEGRIIMELDSETRKKTRRFDGRFEGSSD